MNLKNLSKKLNIFKECREYQISLWQCPRFLFLLMGIIIIATIFIIYFLSLFFFPDPLVVSLIVLITTLILFVIDFFITQSFERLLKAQRIQSEFIKITSHQLFSPINQMKWTLESLEKKFNFPQEYLKNLKESANKLQSFCAKLVLLSQIESNSLVLVSSQFSLAELAKKIVEETRSLLKESQISLDFFAEGKNFFVVGDEAKIRLVIENLLANAIQSIKEKGQIFVRVKEKKDKIFCEVQDTGIGIPEKEKQYVFQKFFRLESPSKYQSSQLGLGLYLAKKIVEKSGGKINFSSKENKGSTFYFYLPAKK